MTLRNRFPSATPDDFAWSDGPPMVGKHAYCPTCARDDVQVFGAPVSRCADAGLWRLACGQHRVLLDSVVGAPPRARYRKSSAREVYVSTIPAVGAPPFALAFERAIVRAQAGNDVGPAWQVRDPSRFIAQSVELASLMLVQRRPGPALSAAASLLGDDRLFALSNGEPEYDGNLIRRFSSYARVRAFAAASLLMLTRQAARRFDVATWAKRHAPFSRPLLIALAPWEVAAEAWGRRNLERVLELAAGWPAPIAGAARAACTERLRMMGAL